jgi:hypothetical protein
MLALFSVTAAAVPDAGTPDRRRPSRQAEPATRPAAARRSGRRHKSWKRSRSRVKKPCATETRVLQPPCCRTARSGPRRPATRRPGRLLERGRLVVARSGRRPGLVRRGTSAHLLGVGAGGHLDLHAEAGQHRRRRPAGAAAAWPPADGTGGAAGPGRPDRPPPAHGGWTRPTAMATGAHWTTSRRLRHRPLRQERSGATPRRCPSTRNAMSARRTEPAAHRRPTVQPQVPGTLHPKAFAQGLYDRPSVPAVTRTNNGVALVRQRGEVVNSRFP